MQDNNDWANSEIQVPPGVVELREDIPLKAGTSFSSDRSRCCGGGPKFILTCFAALSAAITLALFTQIYYGVEEVVPHGSVSSSSSPCSRVGTNMLKMGGRAIDAAAASAICLAVLKPHRTGLDASGSMLEWNYRSSHTLPPRLFDWGGPNSLTNETSRIPRLIAAMATIHATFGVLPWSVILEPSIDLARNGFKITEDLATVAAEHKIESMMVAGTNFTNPVLADYLEQLQKNTSKELSIEYGLIRVLAAQRPTMAGRWKVYVVGAGAKVVRLALKTALQPPNTTTDVVFQRVVATLQEASINGTFPPTGVSSGLAVIDKYDTYIALATGLSQPFSSGPVTPEGWWEDRPLSPIDLAPAIIVDEHVCGTRYVIGAESASALAQGAAAVLTSGLETGAIEKPRVAVYPNGVLGIEALREPPSAMLPAPLVNATLPYAAMNVVQQKADALLSHADSRGGGLAFRF